MALTSSIRLAVLALFVAGLSLSPGDGQTQSQAQHNKPKPPPLTAEQKEKVKERDRLISQINKLLEDGELNAAARLGEKMLILQKAIYGDANEQVGIWEDELAKLHLRRQDFPAARAASAASLKTYTQVFGKNDWRVTDARLALRQVNLLARLSAAERAELALADDLKSQAIHFFSRAKYVEAKTIFEKVLALHERILGEDHPDTADSYYLLAFVLSKQSQYAQAEKLGRKALEINRRVLGEEHPRTAGPYQNLAQDLRELANVHLEREDFAAARAASTASLNTYTQIYGKNHWQVTDARCDLRDVELLAKVTAADRADLTLAERLNGEGTDLVSRGKYFEGKRSFEKALAIRTRILGDEHPYTATIYNNLGRALSEQGQYAEAEKWNRKALAIRRKVLGPEHPATAMSYNNMAYDLSAQGQYAEAEKLNRKALTIRRRVYGEEHRETTMSYNNLALDVLRQGQYAEGEKLYRKP